MKKLKIKKELFNWVRCHVPVRRRYIFTRLGGVRLRYIVMPLLVAFLLSGASLTGFSKKSDASYNQRMAGNQRMAEQQSSLMAALDPAVARSAVDALQKNVPGSIASKPKALQPKEKMVSIAKGGTLDGALQRAGLSAGESYRMVTAIKEYSDPRRMRPGQELTLRFDPVSSVGEGAGGAGYEFSSLALKLDALQTLVVLSDDAGTLSAAIEKRPVETRLYAKQADIEVSLYGSAAKAGVPSSIIAEAIRIYSWDVDFQRDIRQGDQVEVLYEQIETKDGRAIKSGNIIYARLNVNGRDIPVYRYETKSGDVDYFTENGRSIRKALMKTPVDGARLSSGFGRRKHPVLGYGKMHKGLDFAAPTGTPIYAAGDGVVEKAGPFSSFGNYVRIRHNATLKTAYAHMHKINRSVTAGARVKQGQIIGTIGTTGRSTGPHLHYEVHVSGKQVNPRTHKSPQGETLKGAQLAAFKKHAGKINSQYAGLITGLKYADAAGF